MKLLHLCLLSTIYSFPFAESERPVNFPSSIEIAEIDYENWSKEICIKSIWTASPKNSIEILQVANWAVKNQYRLRPSGNQYSWSPLTVTTNHNESTVIIKMNHLKNIMMAPKDESGLSSVSVETGATMEELLTYLQERGLAVASVPVIGEATVGGVLVTGSHGSGLANDRNKNHGFTFGSLSNAIVQLKAVVWNDNEKKFELQDFHRSTNQINPLLVNLGRILVTSVTLRVGQDMKVRCLSRMNLHINQLFAPPLDNGQGNFTENSLADLANKYGVVGSIFFPFTSYPWVRIWTPEKEKPKSSREVTKPYNYPFIENIPEKLADLMGRIQSRNSKFTPVLTKGFAGAIRVGLKLTRSADIWGWTKNVNLHVQNSTVRVSVNGFVVLTSRARMQQVVYEIFQIYNENIKTFARSKKYPMNAPLEIRISNSDDPNDVYVKGAQAPSFAPSSPVQGRPELDTCIWVDLTTFSKTKFVSEFVSKIEDEFEQKFNGDYAIVRREWSKRWAYTDENGPFSNRDVIRDIPKHYTEWQKQADIIRQMDPRGIFENMLVNTILP